MDERPLYEIAQSASKLTSELDQKGTDLNNRLSAFHKLAENKAKVRSGL